MQAPAPSAVNAPGEPAPLQGLMESRDEAGVLRLQSYFLDGKLHGLLTSFDEKGQRVQEACYAYGLQEGKTRLYADAHLFAERPYKGGLLQGEALTYALSGAVSARQPYVAGVLEGESLFYHLGQLVRSERHVRGVLQGRCRDYGPDGQLVQQSHYENNLLDGTLTRYWPGGSAMEVLNFKAGKQDAAVKRFAPDGREVTASADKLTFMLRVEKWVKG